MDGSRPLVVLVTGDPVDRVRSERGGFAELIRGGVGGAWTGPWLDIDVRDGSALPSAERAAGVLITGSASSVTERAPWMLRIETYLRTLVEEGVPTFGICFGHQLLGQALGGNVTKNPRGREIGTVAFEIVHRDPLLDLAEPPFRANTTHLDTVERLPLGATVLAKTTLDSHAAVRFSEAAWGVQFHPEMDGAVVRGYLEARRDLLVSEGLDADALFRTTDDGVAGASTLRRFAELVRAMRG